MQFIEAKYKIGKVVFLSTDEDQKKRLIVGINVRPGNIIYLLTCGERTTEHYEMEITEQQDLINSL